MTISSSVSSRSSRVIIRAPYELTRTITVKPREAGESALHFFRNRFPYLSEEKWLQRLESGWIRSNGLPVSAGTCLSAHQVLTHYSPAVSEPSVSGNITVVKETKNWLIVCKPAPLPMHQGGRYYKNTLAYLLKEMGYSDLNPVHRLDAVTSGLVLFAKNRKWAIQIRKEFDENRVEKWYHAIVEGEMTGNLAVDQPIRRRRGFVFECGNGLENAKPALTRFIPEKVLPGGKTLVRCIPETGRTHQIRLHLREAGFPVADDPIYGPKGDDSGQKLQNSAISLRSSGIVIKALRIKGVLPVTKGF
ncbi:pseudouridine synthase [Rhodohalobacter mucosus]|nr:pseudouridine synthase [Rhodohalobacter mucosus]